MCNIVFQLFGLGGVAKSQEEEDDLMNELLNELMMALFVKQPLALLFHKVKFCAHFKFGGMLSNLVPTVLRYFLLTLFPSKTDVLDGSKLFQNF